MSELRECAIKVCWWCVHFNYQEGFPGYSDLTPGYEMSMSCRKGHWDFDAYKTSQDEFGDMLGSATTCPDFKTKEGKGHAYESSQEKSQAPASPDPTRPRPSPRAPDPLKGRTEH